MALIFCSVVEWVWWMVQAILHFFFWMCSLSLSMPRTRWEICSGKWTQVMRNRKQKKACKITIIYSTRPRMYSFSQLASNLSFLISSHLTSHTHTLGVPGTPSCLLVPVYILSFSASVPPTRCCVCPFSGLLSISSSLITAFQFAQMPVFANLSWLDLQLQVTLFSEFYSTSPSSSMALLFLPQTGAQLSSYTRSSLTAAGSLLSYMSPGTKTQSLLHSRRPFISTRLMAAQKHSELAFRISHQQHKEKSHYLSHTLFVCFTRNIISWNS